MDATLILEVAIGYCLGALIVGFVKGIVEEMRRSRRCKSER